jgi:hypothetical protein
VAANDYDVALYADDSGTPFRVERISAGAVTERTVPAPPLGPGRHRLVAVAQLHGWRVPSGELQLMVPADGVTTREPVGIPTPVSIGPAQDPASEVSTSAPVQPVMPEPPVVTAPVTTPVAVSRRAPAPVPPDVILPTSRSGAAPSTPTSAFAVTIDSTTSS